MADKYDKWAGLIVESTPWTESPDGRAAVISAGDLTNLRSRIAAALREVERETVERYRKAEREDTEHPC